MQASSLLERSLHRGEKQNNFSGGNPQSYFLCNKSENENPTKPHKKLAAENLANFL